MCGEKCPIYNAIQNNKFEVNKTVNKLNKICSVSLYDSSLLLCRFLTFFKILTTPTINAGLGENCAVFK
jgi:hypothetical protein